MVHPKLGAEKRDFEGIKVISSRQVESQNYTTQHPHPPTILLNYLNNFLKLELHLLFSSFFPLTLPLVVGLSSLGTSNIPPLVDGLCLVFGLPNDDHLSGVAGRAETGVADVCGRSVSGEKWIVCLDRADENGVEERAVESGVKGVLERGEEKRLWLVFGRVGVLGLGA